MQFMKSFVTEAGGGSTLGGVLRVVAAINKGKSEKDQFIEIRVDSTKTPPPWCLTISSKERLQVASDAWEHPYWDRSSMGIDSTHCTTNEGLLSHTATVEDLEDNSTLVGIGISSGETTQTANWFKMDLVKMVRRTCNPEYTLVNTICVQDGSQAYRTSGIQCRQYIVADPWHMFRTLLASIPKFPRGQELSSAQIGAQR